MNYKEILKEINSGKYENIPPELNPGGFLGSEQHILIVKSLIEWENGTIIPNPEELKRKLQNS